MNNWLGERVENATIVIEKEYVEKILYILEKIDNVGYNEYAMEGLKLLGFLL